MAITPSTIYDTFSRVTASNEGWGVAESGHAWVTSATTHMSVSGGSAQYNVTPESPTKIARYDGSSRQTEDEILMRFNWNSSSLHPLTNFGPALSVNDSNDTYYYAAIHDNWGEISIGCSINNIRWELNRSSFSGFSKNDDYWIRFKRTKNNLYMKVWIVGTIEPSSWSLTSLLWNGSNPPGAGRPGFYARGTNVHYQTNIKQISYWSSTEEYNTSEIIDDFTRNNNYAWGVTSGTGRHVWDGAVSFDPQAFRDPLIGFVQTSGGGRGVLEADTNQRTTIIGGDRTGSTETEVTFRLNPNPSGEGVLRFGVRARRFYSGGRLFSSGYFLQVVSGTNTIQILHRDVNSVGFSVIGSGTATEEILPNKLYRGRVQAVGNTIRASVWPNGASEPVWQIELTDSKIGYAGTGALSTNTTSGTGRIYIYSFRHGAPRPAIRPTPNPEDPPAPPAPRNYTTPGTLSVVEGTQTDTKFRVRATYSNDENSNAYCIISHRKVGTTTWSNEVSRVAHQTYYKWYEADITGLEKNTSYDIRATFGDSDGVNGTNPLNLRYNTAALGVGAGEAEITSILTDRASIRANYLLDLDNNSTARLLSRVTSQPVFLIEDHFLDAIEEEPLRSYKSIRGGEWIRHPSSSLGIDSFYHRSGYFINSSNVDQKVLYKHSTTTSSDEITVSASFQVDNWNNTIGIAGRIDKEQETYYAAGINASTSSWELFKVVNGVKHILDESPIEQEAGSIYQIELRLSNTIKSLYVNGHLIMGSDDNSISSSDSSCGYYAEGVSDGSPSNQILLTNFYTSIRGDLGEWVNHGWMTPNRSNKYFSHTALGLEADTVYEFRVDFFDTSEGGKPSGINPALVIGMTPGRASELLSVSAAPSQTSAILRIQTRYDTNQNATLSFQYKAVQDQIWTTVGFQNITKYRDEGRFELVLAGLRPSTTYETRVIIDDPDGLIKDSPDTLSGLFTTEGYSRVGATPEKFYIWKIYDRKGNYLTTIEDAPLPEFNLYENGGTTDQELNLFRSFSEINMSKVIDFQHRIDIWAIDPSSKGMGPNLINDPDITEGAWLVGQTSGPWGRNSRIDLTGGPDNSSAIRIEAPSGNEYPQASNPIHIDEEVPLHISCIVKALGSKIRLYARSFDASDNGFDTSDDIAESVGPEWQKISINYTPPPGTEYIRVFVENDNRGTMWADKFDVRAKEMKIYSGNIESFTPKIDTNGETVSIEVLGLTAFLSDDYIEHLQFVDNQPQKDVKAGRLNEGAADPSNMVRRIIDEARRQNPRFPIYYTSDSIKDTGTLMQYTFRDQQIRHALDKCRELCPAGWHYFIAPDGLLSLRGPQHATTHFLRIGVEISHFQVEKSIRNLKNYIRVKGRQDEDQSESGSEGSINYVTFDQASIDKFGKRVQMFSDSQIIDSETARLVGDGRLEEYNREEQRVQCTIPDEKYLTQPTGALRGYNIEAFQPGDNIIVIDPITGQRYSYWNQMVWNEDNWDVNDVFHPLPEGVPIKTVKYKADEVELELSERPPSQVGDYAKMYRWIALKDSGN